MTQDWHRSTVEEVATQLGAPPDGLDAAAVEARRRVHGPNLLPRPARVTLRAVIMHQFTSPLIYVLLAAAAVSVALGEVVDAGFIASILLINAVLGGVQEWRAEASASALQAMLRIRARVRRAGAVIDIDAEELVPGDRLLLKAGSRVPADLRLTVAHGLVVDEAALTGESVPVDKSTAPLGEVRALGDRRNMAYAGTTIVGGRGEGIVVATGTANEVGKIAADVVGTEAGRMPLIERMDAFARRISYLVLAVGVALVIVGLLRGMPFQEIFFVAVAVAVSAVPEGLPIAMTVALSVGMRRMARRHVLVRRLAAVEGLGSCTLIATDKTGTLTLDQQTVREIRLEDGVRIAVDGAGFSGDGRLRAADGGAPDARELAAARELAWAALLCNEGELAPGEVGWTHSGDPVDVALLGLAWKTGLDPRVERAAVEVLAVLPFAAERRVAAVWFRRPNGGPEVAVKGAIEVLAPLAGRGESQLRRMAEDMAAAGLRVLAIGGGPVDRVDTDALPPIRLYGLVGMIDPLRPEAGPAVAACRAAGISVVMVTGDHPSTALAIARDLGIADCPEEVVSGADLGMPADPTDEIWRAALRGRKVFARVAPLQKRAIVEGFVADGHFVAVTGDGVNDAAALQAAHLGVAMGSGTDVARDAASLVVTDDNFASIAAAVEEGRFVYANLRGIIRMLVSTGVGEVLLVLLALIFGLPLPMTALQLLWLNLVTNGVQDVALAFEPGDPAEMKRPPRATGEGVFDRPMIRSLLLTGAAMTLISFGLWWGLLAGGVEESAARNLVVLLVVMMQNVHVVNCRSETRSIFRRGAGRNPVLIPGILAAQGVHLGVMQTAFGREVLDLAPISIGEWGMLLPLALVVVLVSEFDKAWARRKAKTGGSGRDRVV